MTETAFDFDARYTVDGYGGVAFYAWEFEKVRDEDYEWSGIEYDNTDRVVMTMVGDDHKFTFDVDEVTVIGELDYCAECGQVGCTHDGRDREEDS